MTEHSKDAPPILDGVTVADFSRLLPGPWCAQMLGDFGADVIKVEQPGVGDHSRHNPPNHEKSSVYYNSVNGNKRGIALDLASPAGRDVAHRLFEKADVVIESFRPGVSQKLGIDYEAARKTNPRLIYCSISGYGQTGPLARVPGHDLVIQSMTGVMGMTLDQHPVPQVPAFQAADYAAAAMAPTAILGALMRRQQTGEGCHIDLSMFDCLFYMCNIVLTGGMARLAGQSGEPMLQAFGGNPRYNTYLAKDGKPVAVSLLEAKVWAEFCRVIEREDLIFEDEGPEDRHTTHGNRADLFRNCIADYCGSLDRDDLLAVMEEHQVPVCAVYTPDEALASGTVAARGMIEYIDHPVEGRIPQLASPFAPSGLTRGYRTGAPDLGADNDSILADLGYSEEQRSELRDTGVIEP
ncbi:MAG: CoA transferase [Alphaproteobacteria bacterium]|nr:CoA transferase [Alphaproteobacteria bacterium]